MPLNALLVFCVSMLVAVLAGGLPFQPGCWILFSHLWSLLVVLSVWAASAKMSWRGTDLWQEECGGAGRVGWLEVTSTRAAGLSGVWDGAASGSAFRSLLPIVSLRMNPMYEAHHAERRKGSRYSNEETETSETGTNPVHWITLLLQTLYPILMWMPRCLEWSKLPA